MFKKIKMEGKFWGVFLVNPNDETDRYLVTSPLERESDAENLANDMNRILIERGESDVAAKPI